MNLEKQVCTKEQSQKLYNLGIRGESLFYHTQSDWGIMPKKSIDFKNGYVLNAFTTAELGEMLPEYYESHSGPMYENWYCGPVECGDGDFFAMEATEAQAKATMLINLLETENAIEGGVEACNKRLAE